eukprot:Polyplicarium_translucidae@DN2091_c0_g1_i1.p1
MKIPEDCMPRGVITFTSDSEFVAYSSSDDSVVIRSTESDSSMGPMKIRLHSVHFDSPPPSLLGLFWMGSRSSSRAHAKRREAQTRNLVLITSEDVQVFRLHDARGCLDVIDRLHGEADFAWWEAETGYVVSTSRNTTLRVIDTQHPGGPVRAADLELKLLPPWATLRSRDIIVHKIYSETYAMHKDPLNACVSLRCLSSDIVDIVLETGHMSSMIDVTVIDDLVVVHIIARQESFIFDLHDAFQSALGSSSPYTSRILSKDTTKALRALPSPLHCAAIASSQLLRSDRETSQQVVRWRSKRASFSEAVEAQVFQKTHKRSPESPAFFILSASFDSCDNSMSRTSCLRPQCGPLR